MIFVLFARLHSYSVGPCYTAVIQLKIFALIFLNIGTEWNNYNFASNFLLQAFQMSVFCIKEINKSMRKNIYISAEMQTERKYSIVFMLAAEMNAFAKIQCSQHVVRHNHDQERFVWSLP